jgi:diacylglycerol kinase family enzyme
VFKGTHLEDPSISCFTGTRVEVSSDRPFVMYADGDPLADLPATVEIRPRSLHVVVPRG